MALASAVGTSPDTVRRWELGAVTPQPRFRGGLAAALQLDLPELFVWLDLPADSESNVVALPGASRVADQTVRGQPDPQQQKRFDEMVFAGLEQGFATSADWTMTVASLAKRWNISWGSEGRDS